MPSYGAIMGDDRRRVTDDAEAKATGGDADGRAMAMETGGDFYIWAMWIPFQ